MPDINIVSSNTESDISLQTSPLEIEQNLDNSREVNFFWQCSNPEFEAVVEQVLDELREYYLSEGGASRGFRRESNVNMLRRLVADLHICSLGNPERWLAVPFNREYYSVNTRYQPLFGAHGAVSRVRDFLQAREYAEVVGGFNDRSTRVGRRTRMRATQRLIDLLSNISVCDYSSVGETVLLKDSAKQLIEYDNTALTNRIRGDIEIINNLISNSWIDLRVPDETFQQICSERLIELSRNKLSRIFNNSSFEQGGRFFRGWWIEIPKQFRPYITIDASETVELDYSSMHLAILYAEAGESLPEGDLYAVDGYDRQLVKTAFTRGVNVSSREAAITTVRRKYPEMTREQLSEMMALFEELHSPISSSLFAGEGLRLQYMDSRIANLTMLRLSLHNIVALPVHDSFIVKREHEEQLRSAMISSYNSIVEGAINVEAGIVTTLELQDDIIDFSASMERYSLYFERQLQHEG